MLDGKRKRKVSAFPYRTKNNIIEANIIGRRKERRAHIHMFLLVNNIEFYF